MNTQLYSHKFGFNHPYHIPKENIDHVGFRLSLFLHKFCNIKNLIFDGEAVQNGSRTHSVIIIRIGKTNHHMSKLLQPNNNQEDVHIVEVEKWWYWMKLKNNSLDRLWNFGIMHVCKSRSVTTSSLSYSKCGIPLKPITGISASITKYLNFGFYNWIFSSIMQA